MAGAATLTSFWSRRPVLRVAPLMPRQPRTRVKRVAVSLSKNLTLHRPRQSRQAKGVRTPHRTGNDSREETASDSDPDGSDGHVDAAFLGPGQEEHRETRGFTKHERLRLEREHIPMSPDQPTFNTESGPRERLGRRYHNHLDMTCEALADEAAELRARLRDVEAERDSYRELAQVSIHVPHELTTRDERRGERLRQLVEELHALRESQRGRDEAAA